MGSSEDEPLTSKGYHRPYRQLLFSGLCFFGGQYFPPVSSSRSRSQCLSRWWITYLIVVTVCAGILNLVPTILFPVEWFCRPMHNYGICYTPDSGNTTNSSCALGDNGSNQCRFYTYTKSCPSLHQYIGATLWKNRSNEDWVYTNARSCPTLHQYIFFFKIVVFFCSFSSSVSYVLILYPLIKQYVAPHFKNSLSKRTLKYLALSNDLNLGNVENLNSENVECLDSGIVVSQHRDDRDCLEPPPLTPFSDDITNLPSEDNCSEQYHEVSTPLSNRESFYFNFILVLSLTTLAGCTISLLWAQSSNFIKPLTPSCQEIDSASFLFFAYSLFCTTVSCFLFSKVAYGVSERCENMLTWVKHVNVSSDDIQKVIDRVKQETEDAMTVLKRWKESGLGNQTIINVLIYLNNCFLPESLSSHTHTHSILKFSPNEIKLYYIQARDNYFLKQAKATIKRFELWYSAHWICYTISSFLTIALFLESITEQVRHAAPVDEPAGIEFGLSEHIFLGLFSITNLLLFLYPCFRAAAITSARQGMIKKFNQLCCLHIAPSIKQSMVDYLRNQGFGFQIQLLCARLTFEFNIAYLSIFIGLLGILSRLSSQA